MRIKDSGKKKKFWYWRIWPGVSVKSALKKKNFSHEGFQHGMCIGRVWVEKKKKGV